MMPEDPKQDWPGENEASLPLPLEEQPETEAEAPVDSEPVTSINGETSLEEAAAADAVDQQPETTEAESVWTRARRAMFGGGYHPDDDSFKRRVNQLTEAIESAPETPGNYVLRGELYLAAKFYELAREDFQTAATLAAIQFERSDWGIIAQAMRDRALVGLARAEKKLSP